MDCPVNLYHDIKKSRLKIGAGETWCLSKLESLESSQTFLDLHNYTCTGTMQK